ncbi:hypothetical protein EV361DRAFT_872492 [Lentinula raphanica]|nr:hypothetical protein EV361DRAFT_872492 [Lentinula raphanica]
MSREKTIQPTSLVNLVNRTTFTMTDDWLRMRTRNKDVEMIDRQVVLMSKDRLFGGTIKAFIAGTHCDAPILVNVPIDVNIQTWRSVDDLNVRMYVWRPDKAGVRACDSDRYYIDHFPDDATTALPTPYTFFCEPDNGPSARNSLVQDKALPFDKQVFPTIRGNIVVIKHQDGEVVDMEMWDWPLVKVILEWLVVNRLQYGITMSTCYDVFAKRLPTVIPAVPSPPARRTITHTPVPSARASMVFRIGHLRCEVFTLLGICSLFSLAATNHQMRSWVLKFYKGRVTSVLSNVLPSDKHSAFLQLINSNSGRIAGSTAYQIADPMSNFNPSDLNILVPIGCRVGLRRQLKLRFDCTENSDGIEIGRKYLSNWSKGTSHLMSPTGHPITITESNDDSFIPLMVAGYSTAETCPRLWRRSQGGRWTATWNWGGLADNDDEEDYDEEKELDWGSFEWKIGHDCVNPCCGWKNRIPLELCRYKSWRK